MADTINIAKSPRSWSSQVLWCEPTNAILPNGDRYVNSYLYRLSQLSYLMREVSLFSGHWIVQKFPTDQTTECKCQWNVQLQMRYLYHQGK